MGADEKNAGEVHCLDCKLIASLSEEARANGFCHV
jgi:hypothetical protein